MSCSGPCWGRKGCTAYREVTMLGDQHAQHARPLLAVTRYVGRTLRTRADRATVRFYDDAV
jgi:hypothetical protein